MAKSRKQNKGTRRRKSRSKGTTRRAKAGVVKFPKSSRDRVAAMRERERTRRLEAALATAAAHVQAQAAVATPASDLARLRQVDLDAQLGRASRNPTVVDVAAAIGTLAALGRAHTHLNQELTTALEQMRGVGIARQHWMLQPVLHLSRQSYLEQEQEHCPPHRTSIGATGEISKLL